MTVRGTTKDARNGGTFNGLFADPIALPLNRQQIRSPPAAVACSIPVVLKEFTVVKRLRALLVAALVALWMAPDARAFAIGVHLLVADHHHSDRESTDGHHETNPRLETSHTHELAQTVCSQVGRHDTCTLATPAANELIAVSSELSLYSVDSTTPSPPVPLFLSHCSLLI